MQSGRRDDAISLVSDDDETEKGQGVLVSASTDGGGSSSGVVAKDLAFWGPWLDEPAAIIRDISFCIQPEMTPFGYSILMLGTEMCDKDCPKARSGGACFAAARILKVPPAQQMVSWMKRAEQLFAKEVRIMWLPATRPDTFKEWLVAARQARLEFVPADGAGDAFLAAQMCEDEHYLLGYVPGESKARTNAAPMELLRWLLLDKPRPQLAFAILQLKPILIEQCGDFDGSDFDAVMPRTWASQWASRAAKVTSTRFYWVGQGGVLTTSDDAQVRERSAADSYKRAARQRLCCVHPGTGTRKDCRGPLAHFSNMCKPCRTEPEAVLRDPCLALIRTGAATPSCHKNNLCSACTGVPDRRKLKPGQERIKPGAVSRYQPCPGGCLRKTDACQQGYRRCNGDEEKQRAWCAWRARANPSNSKVKRECATLTMSERMCGLVVKLTMS
jgi:hypothetical protein